MEVELKARADDLNALRRKLETTGAVFKRTVEQKDSYFKMKGYDRKAEGPGDWIVRIRSEKRRKTLTMKIFTDIRGAWVEHETDISNDDAVRNMLEAMGMVNVFTFNKKRIYGACHDFEICLDDIKELGRFIEVALNSDEKEEARGRIREFMKSLGISRTDSRGYGEIFEEEKMGHNIRAQ